jgi:hypothetical protein
MHTVGGNARARLAPWIRPRVERGLPLGFDRESSETVRSSGEQWHGGEAEDGSPAARPRRCSSRPRGLAAEPHGTRPVRAA